MKKIIAIIGRAGSGKDYAGDFLAKKLLIPHYGISSSLRIIAQKQGINDSRENLISLGKKLAFEYGDEYLAKILIEHTESPIMIISGMRQIGQLKYCRDNYQVVFIGINTVQKIRFTRLIENGKFSGSYKEFLKLEELDEGSVQNVGKCMNLCDEIIENNESVKKFEQQLLKSIK